MKNISRRKVIKVAGATLAVIGAAGAVSAADKVAGDEHLLELEREFHRLEAEYGAVAKQEDELESSLPEWVRRGPFVEISSTGGTMTHAVETESNLDAIENDLLNRVVKRSFNDEGIVEAVSKFMEGRRTEFKRQQRCIEDYKESVGLVALQAALERLYCEQQAIAAEIIAEKATGPAGLAVKARVLVWQDSGGPACDDLLASLVADTERLAMEGSA